MARLYVDNHIIARDSPTLPTQQDKFVPGAPFVNFNGS